MTRYTAMKCPCGHPTCKAWMVDPVAAVQSVRFTEAQARAVAATALATGLLMWAGLACLAVCVAHFF